MHLIFEIYNFSSNKNQLARDENQKMTVAENLKEKQKMLEITMLKSPSSKVRSKHDKDRDIGRAEIINGVLFRYAVQY